MIFSNEKRLFALRSALLCSNESEEKHHTLQIVVHGEADRPECNVGKTYWNEKCKNGVIPKCRGRYYKKMLSG